MSRYTVLNLTCPSCGNRNTNHLFATNLWERKKSHAHVIVHHFIHSWLSDEHLNIFKLVTKKSALSLDEIGFRSHNTDTMLCLSSLETLIYYFITHEFQMFQDSLFIHLDTSVFFYSHQSKEGKRKEEVYLHIHNMVPVVRIKSNKVQDIVVHYIFFFFKLSQRLSYSN